MIFYDTYSIMNYLSFLSDDLLNIIYEHLAYLYEKDIENINNKLLKVKKSVEGLQISMNTHYDAGDIGDTGDTISYSINYKNVSYCIDKYLYSKYSLENVIIIYKLKLIVIYNADENTLRPIILQSIFLYKPLYLDILREISRIYETQAEIFGYYDYNKCLQNIRKVKESEYSYLNINPYYANNINYITFDMM